MDATTNTVPSLPAVGDTIHFSCFSRQCAGNARLPVTVSDCANHSYLGAAQFQCGRCNRLFVCCTKCYSADGAGILCFLIEPKEEKNCYSRHASVHFASQEHLAQYSSAHSNRENHSALFSSTSGEAFALHHGDDDTPFFDCDNEEQSNARTASSAEDLLRQLSQIGLDPHQGDFSSKLFPDMPAAGQYFLNEHFHPGSGRAKIVRAALGRDQFDPKVNPMETDVNLELHKLCLDIGIEKAAHLFEVIQMIRHQDSFGSPSFYPIRIPINRVEIRSMFTDNASSISKLLPLPPVIELKKDLTYCPVENILRHALASDVENEIACLWDVGGKEEYSHPSESPRAAEIARRCASMRNGQPTFCVQLHYWEDDADANTTKKDRGSIHIATITLSCRNSSEGTSQFTYVISIGAKDDDHELFRSRLVTDLNKLSGAGAIPMYHGGLKKVVPVYAGVHSCIADRVGRGALSGQSQGNGRFTAVWGIAMDLQSVHAGVPLCSNCLSSIMASLPVDSSCQNCDGWHYRLGSQLLRYPPPPHFPEDAIPEDGFLRPVKVTAAIVRQRIDTAVEKMQSSQWSHRQTDAYLRTIGLSGSWRERIIEAIANGNPAPHPSFLSLDGVDVDSHIDTVMHLVYLGIEKYTLKMLASLSKLRGRTNQYHDAVAPQMQLLSSMKLEWLKIQPWNYGKLGGLVGENFLGLARLGVWLILPLEKMMEEDASEEASDPDGPVSSWRLGQCKTWLSNRKENRKALNEAWMKSLEVPPNPLKMNVHLYRQRCKELMDRPQGPPPIRNLAILVLGQDIHPLSPQTTFGLHGF